MSDKREGWGWGVGGGYEDAAPKDMPFLPGYAGLQEERNAFTHPGALFPFSVVDAERKGKNVSGCVPSLSAGRPRGRARRKRETRLRFLPTNRQRLPMKRDTVQLDLWGDAEVVLTQGLSKMDLAQKIQKS